MNHLLSYCLYRVSVFLYTYIPEFEIDYPSQIIMASTRGPKRAKNAFLFFCDDHRAEMRATIAEAQPDLSGRELTVAVQRELGKDWTTFKHTTGCAIYHERAALDKARYQREKMEGVTITVAAKRPRGRPRKGAVWNEETGAYDEAEMPPPQPRRPRGRPPKDSYWCGKTGKYVKKWRARDPSGEPYEDFAPWMRHDDEAALQYRRRRHAQYLAAKEKVSQAARDAVAACLAQAKTE